MQRRTDKQSPSTTASGAGAKAVTFKHPFFVGKMLLIPKVEQIVYCLQLVLLHKICNLETFLKYQMFLERDLLFTSKTLQML